MSYRLQVFSCFQIQQIFFYILKTETLEVTAYSKTKQHFDASGGFLCRNISAFDGAICSQCTNRLIPVGGLAPFSLFFSLAER